MIYDVYVGTYTGPKGGDGIYHLKLDTQAQTLTPVASYPEVTDNASFLVVKPEHVYAVSEGYPSGAISAFNRDKATGALTFVNKIEAPGTAMCHLTMWEDGKHLSASNYGSGSLVACSLKEDGSVEALCDFKQHEGVGFDAAGRQAGPHVHSSLAAPNGKELYVADLGLDWIACYEICPDGKLRLAPENRQIHTPGGQGPRHFVFSENGEYLYVVTEMGNLLLVYQDVAGTWQCIQEEKLLPPDFEGFNTAADIHLSPDGKFVYGSCRGRDCLTGFRVDAATGKVERIGWFDSCGNGPRNFCMVPDNKHVLITNQVNGNLVLCLRDPETGVIGAPLAQVNMPQAVYVNVMEAGDAKMGNKKAIVTGASRGIGRGIARILAEQGYDIAFSYRTKAEEAEELKQELERDFGVRCFYYQAELQNNGAGEELFEKAVADLGGVDLMVNNAGSCIITGILDMLKEEIDFLINLDFRNYIIMAQCAAKYMVAHGIHGNIINITSSRGERAYPGDAIYGGMKAALNRAIQSLALELGPYGIRINNVAPGFTKNREGQSRKDMGPWAEHYDEHYNTVGAMIPLGTYGTPDDIGNAVAFLASEEASYITGITVRVDGGLILPGMPEWAGAQDHVYGWGKMPPRRKKPDKMKTEADGK